MTEEEIRPQEVYAKLLEHIKQDIEKYFFEIEYNMILCPACGSTGYFAFNKDRFTYEECLKCKTLYVSPRPLKKAFDKYYTESESTKFWATTFYKLTEKNRREKIWKPKAELINKKIKKYAKNVECVVDIGGGYGTFIEEFLKLNNLGHYIIEPSSELAKICKSKNLRVVEKFLEDVKESDFEKGKKVFLSFELFEHLHNPMIFLNSLSAVMEKKSIFIFTTLSGAGLDIQTLWEDSKAIIPPMHLNFLNPKSIEILLKRAGFEILEISTPGKLDLDIMKNNEEKIKDRFWKNFIDYSNNEEKKKMQEFISDNQLSSHMMIICKKI